MDDRLPHGYTNAIRVDGDRVVKRYLGPDPHLRQEREVTARRRFAGHLPVPGVLEVGADHLVLERMPGTPGQEVLLRHPERVLYAVGAMARRLAEVSPGFVHGDFGPQNLLVDPWPGRNGSSEPITGSWSPTSRRCSSATVTNRRGQRGWRPCSATARRPGSSRPGGRAPTRPERGCGGTG